MSGQREFAKSRFQAPMSAPGSISEVSPCNREVRFAPVTDMLSSTCQVRKVPTPEVAASFDYVVGDCEHFIWNDKAKRPGGLAVDDEIKFGWLLDRQIAGLRPT
jgi:hypothetical protein